MPGFGAKLTVFAAKSSEIWFVKAALSAKVTKFFEIIFCFRWPEGSTKIYKLLVWVPLFNADFVKKCLF
jgi:hypothetical protein